MCFYEFVLQLTKLNLPTSPLIHKKEKLPVFLT